MEHESIITIAPVGRDGLLAMSDDFSIHPLICRSGGSVSLWFLKAMKRRACATRQLLL